jgi:hypothetical protein
VRPSSENGGDELEVTVDESKGINCSPTPLVLVSDVIYPALSIVLTTECLKAPYVAKNARKRRLAVVAKHLGYQFQVAEGFLRKWSQVSNDMHTGVEVDVFQ